jgi:hypothetical protein
MSIRDELHALIDVLPDSDLQALRTVLAVSSMPDFVDLPTLIEQQGVVPLTDPLALAEDIWPDDEEVDEFLAARAAWQYEGEDGRSLRP